MNGGINAHSTEKNRMPTKAILNTELHNCTEELNMLMARNHLPNDFRKILHKIVTAGRIMDKKIAPDDQSFRNIPVGLLIVRFSTHFLLTVINDAKIRLDSVNLDTTGGWRRATQVVKHMHYVLKTYGRASRIFSSPVQNMCEAIATGLWMDEDKVEVQGADERNDFMLGLLLNVGNELKALSDNDGGFYDFLGTESKQSMELIIQLLRQVVTTDLMDLDHYGDTGVSNQPKPQPPVSSSTNKQSDVSNQPKPPPPTLPVSPPINNQKRILPPPIPLLPVPEYEDKKPHPVEKHDTAVAGNTDLKSVLNKTVNLLKRLSNGIENQESTVISMGIDCFVEVTRRAVCEINGADLAIDAHWDYAVEIMVVIQQTASDLEVWSMPLHKRLSEMFMAIASGLSATPKQVDYGYKHPTGRSSCILSLLAATGANLNALLKRAPAFFDFMGIEAANSMQMLINLLLSCQHSMNRSNVHNSEQSYFVSIGHSPP